MAEYGENEYFTPTQEEVAEREAQEALRRMVRTEIRRVQTGAADGDIADDIAREEQEKRAVAKRQRSRFGGMVVKVITGDILLNERFKKVYTLLIVLGVIFFTSMATIYASFHSDLKRSKLQREVLRKKERAIRMNEECARYSSHSAIVRRLQERGIEIEDPKSLPKKL